MPLPMQFSLADRRRQTVKDAPGMPPDNVFGRGAALAKAKKAIRNKQPGAMQFNNNPERRPLDVHMTDAKYGTKKRILD